MPTRPPLSGLRAGLYCLEAAGPAYAGRDEPGAGSRGRPARPAPSASLTPPSVRAAPATRGRAPRAACSNANQVLRSYAAPDRPGESGHLYRPQRSLGWPARARHGLRQGGVLPRPQPRGESPPPSAGGPSGRDVPAAHAAGGGWQPRRDSGRHDTASPEAGGRAALARGAQTPRPPPRHPPPRPTSGRARATGAQRRPWLPSLAPLPRPGLAAAPGGLHAPPQSGALLRPSSARAAPLTGATPVAAVPKLPVPVGWHTGPGRESRARSCAPGTPRGSGDSMPCSLP